VSPTSGSPPFLSRLRPTLRAGPDAVQSAIRHAQPVTLACVLALADRPAAFSAAPARFECQRLHGMGGALYRALASIRRNLPVRSTHPSARNANCLPTRASSLENSARLPMCARRARAKRSPILHGARVSNYLAAWARVAIFLPTGAAHRQELLSRVPPGAHRKCSPNFRADDARGRQAVRVSRDGAYVRTGRSGRIDASARYSAPPIPWRRCTRPRQAQRKRRRAGRKRSTHRASPVVRGELRMDCVRPARRRRAQAR